MSIDEIDTAIATAIDELEACGASLSKNKIAKKVAADRNEVLKRIPTVLAVRAQADPPEAAAAGAASPARVVQAETRVATAQQQLDDASATMVEALSKLAGLEHSIFRLSGMRIEDNPTLIAVRQAAHAAVNVYRQAFEALTQAEADLATAQHETSARQAAQVATRREAWLRQHDPEYRELLEDIARYTRRVAETDNIETLRDHRAAQYQLREANKRRAEKLAAASAA
jgi:hypothetical protein